MNQLSEIHPNKID